MHLKIKKKKIPSKGKIFQVSSRWDHLHFILSLSQANLDLKQMDTSKLEGISFLIHCFLYES